MALTPHDRDLLKRCLHHEPGAWNDFIDRYLGLFYHVTQHTADARSVTLSPEDTEDLVAQVLLEIIQNDYAALRQFRGHSSLAAYLTVIARRATVNQMARRSHAVRGDGADLDQHAAPAKQEAAVDSMDAVNTLLTKLPNKERSVVKLYFLDGRSYEEISTELNIPVNSIGPILTRARKKLRGEEE